jgi:hypothetical protein
MKAELAKMDQYKVWDVVDRQPSMRVIGAKWVYTRKIDGEAGKPKGYKARWVAKDTCRSKEWISMSSMHQSHTKILSETFFR